VFILCISLQVLTAAAGGGGAPLFILNEDDSHFYFSRTAEDMSQAGLEAWVDQYAGTKVTHLFLCPNAMRASYNSAVWDPIWDLRGQNAPPDGDSLWNWMNNARLLSERNLDPYAVWIARSREKGLSPWLTMRMNDVHNVDDPGNILHSTFWVQHPEFRRVPENPEGWVDRAFDYLHPEVREHHMKFIRELLERYDPDGLELDWMRFGYHFAPGREAEGRAVLTQFMREVRALTLEWAAKRGHPIQLGARVPAHPDAAIGLGMDGAAWVQEGLIDMLVPTPFWATADYDIPMELWRERLGAAAKNVTLAAGLEVLMRAYPSGTAAENALDTARGFASAALHRGADAIYLFNYMDSAPMQGGPEAYRALLEEGVSPELLAKRARSYPVTYRDTVPAGVDAQVRLPAKAFDTPVEFLLYAGPASEAPAIIVLGLGAGDGAENAVFSVTLNDQPCVFSEAVPASSRVPGATRVLHFTAPPAKAGYNRIQVRQASAAPACEVVWVELRQN